MAYVVQTKTRDHGLGLVIEHNDKTCYILVGSHHWLCKLICSSAYRGQKDASLANTSLMTKLLQAALAGFLAKEMKGKSFSSRSQMIRNA